MIRLLMTSDWQTDFGNLQECETALDELLAAAQKYKPDAIIHAGDAKDAYSPVDVEVVNFWVRAIRRVVAAGYRFIVLLGNHDRVSQSVESKHWLPVLQAAGAEVVSSPKVKYVAGAAVAFLPYSGVREQLISSTSGLVAKTAGHSGPKILVFHAEVSGAVVNASGRAARGLSPEDLRFASFDACFGGHIHKHQRIEDTNAWYIGSPFCQDWGEADSKKGHLLVTVDGAAVKVKRLVTSIPHWYNVEYLEQHGITPEDGAYVRSKVHVTTKKISDQMRAEEERIKAKYGNVRIHTVPELIDKNADVVLRGSTDQEKIEQYVVATLSDESRFEAAQAVAYMASKMSGMKEGATGAAIQFVGVEAENMFVFENVKLRLRKLGLVLIRGVNEDWPGRSNGTGKSSLLSLIPTIAFGQNGKGQKSDAWAYEGNDLPAKGRLIVRDAAHRKIEIIRGRRPHSIRLLIDGEDRSTGIRGTGKKETQGIIEQVLGYDMQTMMNAVYIDQAVANGFVFGTPGARMDLISRFQNLERFEQAQRSVAEDIKRCDTWIVEMTSQFDVLSSDIEDIEAALKSMESRQETEWTAELQAERKELDALIDEHASLASSAQFYRELQSSIDDMSADLLSESVAIDEARKKLGVLEDRIKRGQRLVRDKKCPTCGQDAAGIGKREIDEASKQAAIARSDMERHTKAWKTIGANKTASAAKLDRYETQIASLEQKISVSRDRIADLDKAASGEAERNKAVQTAIATKTSELVLKRRYRRAAFLVRRRLDIEREMMEYAKKAFHRTGIPLYLAMGLCPLLNKAAEEYSGIFTDGKLQISFRAEDGEFIVDVVNPVGSSTVEGQSTGESAMAGLIAAFSLREAAPKTNLLILDEPGAGLDPEGCRMFAKGLLRMKDRFETILLVSHSPYIESILSGETVYTVKKRDGRSRLILSSG